MSEIGSEVGDGRFWVIPGINHANGAVFLGIEVDAGLTERRFSRPGFLACVEEALNVRIVPADAIVIERSGYTVEEAPNAHLYGPRLKITGPSGRHWIRDHEWTESSVEFAGAILIGAEYAEANPPVDEAQVSALADVLRSTSNPPYTDSQDWERAARKILATGRVQVTS